MFTRSFNFVLQILQPNRQQGDQGPQNDPRHNTRFNLFHFMSIFRLFLLNII